MVAKTKASTLSDLPCKANASGSGGQSITASFRDTLRQMREFLEHASKAVKTAARREKVQLALCIRAYLLEKERVGNELQKVAANVAHLRLTETPHTVMPEFIQMCSNICMLDIIVPQKGDSMPTLVAIRALTSLRALGLYTRAKVQSSDIVCFAEVLQHMVRVTSLTVHHIT